MNPFLSGELCWLRPLNKEDLETVADWSHSREVTHHLYRGTFPSYPDTVTAAYDEMVRSDSEIELAIILWDGDQLVGVTGLHSISWVVRSAEFRILIGERQHWGRGVGTEVAQLVTAYGFEILNLHKVWLGVNSENVRALRSYEKCGFVIEGQLRDEVFRNGRYHHVTRMSMLESEYRNLKATWTIHDHLTRQFPPS